MNKKTTLYTLLFFTLLIGNFSYSQINKPFTPRFQTTTRGDMTMIGNAILGKDNNAYNNRASANEDIVPMKYIDVDADATTYNSSSANIIITNPGCAKVVHAGLYWSSMYHDTPHLTDWNTIKFKIPGATTYNNLTATSVIYDGFANPITGGGQNNPYTCYADVTALLQTLTGPTGPAGTYFAANIRATQLSGFIGGWTLVVVYENVNLTSKNITTFDGQAAVGLNGGTTLIPVSGFVTLPGTLPISAKIGVSALDGEAGRTGDALSIKANSKPTYTVLTNPTVAPTLNNFFNSSTTLNGAINLSRNPASTNTLGWDVHLNDIPNNLNSVIPNNETGATLQLSSTSEKYDVFFAAFEVEVIAPEINLVKTAVDAASPTANNLNGQTLAMGQSLYYRLSFKNTGNDDATGLIITDVLPKNILFPITGTITASDLILPPGVTYIYNVVTKTFTFTIPDALVKKGGPLQDIFIKVRTAATCAEVEDACSNVVINQAFLNYRGVLNTQQINNNPSYSGYDLCLKPVAGSTNYFINTDACVFAKTYTLCGNSVQITAGSGYANYVWTDPNGAVIGGNTQSITVSTTGVYHVTMTAPASPPNCKSISEAITVNPYSSTVTTNPIIPFVKNPLTDVVTCPNDGVKLPKIYLCGINDNKQIHLTIPDAANIEWKKLVDTSCAAALPDCANTAPTCVWNTVVPNSADFNANIEGQYKLIITYQNGCFNTFYFNVYKNLLNPTIDHTDIVCTKTGSITISNISAGYEFSLTSSTGPFQASPVFPISIAGDYTVYIRQTGVINGCVFTYPVTVLKKDIVVDIITTDALCNNSFGTIRVQPTGVNPPYYYTVSQGATTISTVGPTPSNDYTFTNLNPGTYTITTKTDDGCINIQNKTINNFANLALTASVSKNVDCTSGAILVSPTGGLSPYGYAIYSYNSVLVPPANYIFQPNLIFDIPAGQEGDYVFIVVDKNNCTAISNLVTIIAEPALVFTATPTNITCSSLINGKITVNSVGSTLGYALTYSIDGIIFQTSNVFTNLGVGPYTITINAAKGTSVCPYTVTTAINQPNPLLGQSLLVQGITCATTGSIQAINVSGGTAPYQYSIDGVTFQALPLFNGLAAGNYTITIKDANNCSITTTAIPLVAPLAPTDLTFTATAVTCPALTSNVTATVVGGTGPYTFQIIAPSAIPINPTSSTPNTATFNGLAVGTYTVKVTDSKSCTYQENYTINAISFINVTGNTPTNVKCKGDANGALTFTVSGFNTSYSYSINGGPVFINQTATTIPLTNLIANTYTITVTDTQTSCTKTVALTVAEPAVALQLNTNLAPKTCLTNGTLTATATGGWGSYQYTLTQPDNTTVGPQTSGVFGNLSQIGNYKVSLTDGNGCAVAKTVPMSAVTNPTLTINPVSDLCFDANGASITVIAAGGTPPYQYSINGGALQNSNVFTSLTPNTYIVKVTDSFGCFATVTQTIAPQLTATTTITKGLDCTASPSATIKVDITGGVAPYKYQVNGVGALITVVGNTFTYTAPTATGYQFIITDVIGCTFQTNMTTIVPLTNPLIASLTPTHNLCSGNATGTITVNMTANLGTAPFQYSLNGVTFQTSNFFNNLAAGPYTVTVKDANACTNTSSININQPNPLLGQSQLVQGITCATTGSIQAINVSGGTAPYQYSIDGVTFQALPLFNGLAAGNYTITIKDANNCSITTTAIPLVAPLAPTDLTFTATAVTCPALTSNVTATVVGGTGPYTFQIIAPSAIPINPTSSTPNTATFNGLAVGTYTVKVTDSKSCTYQENYTINAISFINVTGNTPTNVKCKGDANGALTFTVSGFNTSYSYSINGGPVFINQTATTIPLTNLIANTYTITVTDTQTSCTKTVALTVAEPAVALQLNTNLAPKTCLTNGTLTATATGGWGSYQYTLTQPDNTTVGPQTSGVFGNLSQIGNYKVSLTDGNGCAVAKTVPMSAVTNPTLTINPVSDLCFDANGASITVIAAGGTPPYQYSINGGALQNSNVFTSLTPNTYIVKVTDSFGCFATVTQTIAPQLTATTTITKGLDCTASPSATIKVDITGGVAPYKYQVNGVGALITVVGNTFTYTTPTATGYQFIITDVIGCTFQTNMTTIVPLTNPLIASLTPTHNLCSGNATGTITVNMTANLGTAPFQYSLNGVTFQTSNFFNNLAAGPYTVTVKDANACTNTSSININQPGLVDFVLSKTDLTCSGVPGGGTTPGSITVNTVTGGTQPLKYILSNITFGVIATYNPLTNEVYTFTNVDFGNYSVEIVDINGCSQIKYITIASPPNSLIVTNVTSNCLTGATVKVKVLAIIPGANYQFGILTQNSAPYSLSYQGPDILGGDESTFVNLIPGLSYTFVVHDLVTDCYFIQDVGSPIPPSSAVTTVLDVIQNVSCTGGGNGFVSFTMSNFDPTTTSVTYEIFRDITHLTTGFSGTSAVTGVPVIVSNFASLPPGSYYLLITENGGCVTTSPIFTIKESTNLLTVNAVLVKNDNCNVNAGIISATAQFGTPPYQYQILADIAPAPTTLTWAGSPTSIFNLESGNYIVYAKDANNCIQPSAMVPVGLDATPAITLAVANLCAAQGSFAIDVTRTTNGIAPYTYVVDGGLPFTQNSTPFTISNLLAGLHTITITDSNGCGETKNITISMPIAGSAVVNTQPSCANNDGIVQATATGASGTYSYTINAIPVNTTGATTGLFTGLAAGPYTIIATDGVTNCTVSIPFILDTPTPVVFTTTFTNPSCNTATDGSITVVLNPSNNNPPYTYTLNDGINPPTTQGNPLFSNLGSGNYTITVTSNRGCSTPSLPIAITAPSVLNIGATATVFACNTNNTIKVSTITATATGGTAPYLYSVDGINYQATNTFDVVDTGSVQNITVAVKDFNGCANTTNVIINPLPKITTVAVTQTTALTCTNDETILITVTGGSGSYTYQSLPSGAIVGPQGITATFNLNTPGAYTYQIVDTTTGCSFITTPYTIAPLPIMTVVASLQTAVKCFGDTNGAMAVNITGYTGAYSYQVIDGLGNPYASGLGNTTSPLTITGLSGGNYHVTITQTNSPFCIANSNVITVDSPNLLTVNAVLVKNDNCNVNAGIISATAQFGTPPYQYQILADIAPAPTTLTWAGSSTSIFNLESGNYIVYAKDANNCIQPSAMVPVGLDATPAITLAVANLCAAQGSFAIDVTRTTNGIAPYTYVVDGGLPFTQNSTPFTISNLLAGLHTITITDSNGCGETKNITISMPIAGSAVVNTQPSCANNDGIVQATATGASGTYSYTINAIPVNTTGATTGLFTGLAAGPYTIIATDGVTNCTVSIPFILDTPTPVVFTTTFTNPSCNTATDGSITVVLNPSNNNPPYTYTLNDGINPPTTQGNPLFSNLGSGNYTITVTSNRGCSTPSLPIAITAPSVLNIGATATVFACNTNNTIKVSTITATATGGTAPYLYSVDGINYQATNTFDVVDTGSVQNITVAVKDFNGCANTTNVIINPLPKITAVLVTQTTALTCTNDETILITVTGGSGSYTYQSLPSGAIVGPQGNTATFNLNTPGAYTYQIVDTTTGCGFITTPYTIAPLPIMTVVASLQTAVKCFGDTNGAMAVNITGYTGAYSYQVIDGLGNPYASGLGNTTSPLTITGLSGGNYHIIITQTNSPFCIANSNVITIPSPVLPLSLVVQKTADVTCANNLGAINATGSGGTAPYQYQLTNTTTSTIIQNYSSNAIFTGLGAGFYEIKVRDSNLCETFQNIALTAPNPINANAPVVTNASLMCFGDTNASVTINNVTGGQGVYQYSLNYANGDVAGPQISNSFANLGFGTYTITITDGWQCSYTTLPFTIIQPTQIKATLSVQSTLTCNNNAQLLITASGGTPPYKYSTDGVTYNATNTFSVPAGIYKYYVSDANSCTAILTNEVTINPIVPLQIALDLSNIAINCFGNANASVKATATGGLGSYMYSLLNAALTQIKIPQTSDTFTNLAPGTYTVKVTSLDCTQNSNPFTVTELPEIITNNPVPVNVTCFGLTNGSITVNPTGGTGAYQYAISPNMKQFSNSNVFQNLGAGNYTILVQDSNGCYKTVLAQITEPKELVASIKTLVQEKCAGNKDGSIEIAIIGGNPPYATSFNNDTTTAVYVPNQTLFTNISGGASYTIYIKDAGGCKTSISVPMDAPVIMTPKVNVDYGCATIAIPINNTVTVSVESNIQSQVQYSLDNTTNWQLNNQFANLSIGSHIVYVKHTNGCIKDTGSFTVDLIAPLQLTASETGLNKITAVATGGKEPYQFTFNNYNNGSNNVYIIDHTGVQNISVIDAYGCEAIFPIYATFYEIEIPNFFTPGGNGTNDTWVPKNIANFKDIKISVYDRYGREIAVLRQNDSWDGTYKNTPLPSGDYWYVMELNDNSGRKFVGNITLYR